MHENYRTIQSNRIQTKYLILTKFNFLPFKTNIFIFELHTHKYKYQNSAAALKNVRCQSSRKPPEPLVSFQDNPHYVVVVSIIQPHPISNISFFKHSVICM